MTNDALVKWAEKYNTIYIHTDYSGASCNLKDRYCETQEVLITNYDVSIFNNMLNNYIKLIKSIKKIEDLSLRKENLSIIKSKYRS